MRPKIIRAAKTNQVGIYYCTQSLCNTMKEFDSKTLLFIDDISNLDKPMYYSIISDDIEIPDEIIKLYKVFIIKMSWDKRYLNT